MSIKIGDRVVDRISKLSGIVTARTEYLYGCVRITITPEESKDGKPADAFWIDEAQGQIVSSRVIEPFKAVAEQPSPAGPRDDARRATDAMR